MSVYSVIDTNGKVINRLHYDTGIPPNPHPCFPDCILVEEIEHVNIGYIYQDGKFIGPEPDPNAIVPMLPPDPKDKQIEDLKADVQTLSASLSQVITVLNSITRPTSATKNNPAK